MNKQVVNRYKLRGLIPEKFIKHVDRILSGECVYRTWDNRLVDFEEGTEVQLNIGILSKER